MSHLSVGIAQVDYTPEIGLPLLGNFRSDYAARGVHDPLCSHALVVEGAAGTKLAVLSLDICMVDREHAAMMRRHIAAHCDLPAESILIAATHTHSGPGIGEFGSCPSCDPATSEALLKTAANAVIEAAGRCKPATLRVGHSREERVSFVRRLKCKDGKTHMNWEGLDPDFVIEALGQPDPELITVSIEQDGAIQAVLVNFALHPAILAGDNWLYSADYPAYLREALNRLIGRDVTTVFLNGPCGNVNHIDYSDPIQGRGYQMTQRIGYMLAAAAYESLAGAVEIQDDTVAMRREMVTLPCIKISEERLMWARDVLEKAKNSPAPGQVDGLPDEHYAQLYLTMHEKQDIDDKVEVMAGRVGEIGIVGFPGELFCEFGRQIKQDSPAAHNIVIELANDAVGYLPTREAFEQGGYESSIGSTNYEPGAGDKLTASALGQLGQLFGT